jgi:hypothetical protein
MTKTLDAALRDWVHFQSADNQFALARAVEQDATGHPLAAVAREYTEHRARGDELYNKTLAHFGIPAVIPD